MATATQKLNTACTLDCPDLCELEVDVQGDRIVKITGAPNHPVTQGYICRKVRHFADQVYCDQRIKTPGRRSGPKGSGQFEPIGWDEALDEITIRFQRAIAEYGAESILPFCYGGSNGKLTQDAFDARLFRRLRASRLARTVCAAPSGRAFSELYGKMPSVPYVDYPGAKMIVVWGANLHSSGIHLLPFIAEAQKQGTTLVVVDPRKTQLAKQADLHLPLMPGTDLPVALSMIRYLFASGQADTEFLDKWANGTATLRERAEPWTFARTAAVARIDPSLLEQFAERYAAASPAVIRCGWGPERNHYGGSAVAAVLALPAVAGKFGCRGGGYTMSSSSVWSVATDAAVAEPEPQTRLINMNQLGRVLTEENDPPVACLFVYNANPLATIPHQTLVRRGLERDDLFTVVFDPVMTDTARYADLVLPATTFMEHTDYRVGYGTGYLSTAKAVIPAVGEARPNYEVFRALCDRLEVSRDGDPSTPEEMFQSLFDQDQLNQARKGVNNGSCLLPPPAGERPIQFVDVHPNTPSGRIELVPSSLEAEAPGGLYCFNVPETVDSGHARLVLLSPSTSSTINSTLGQLDRRPAKVGLHPLDAESRGIEDGDRVRVFNEWGEVHCHAEYRDDAKQGVAQLAKGLWSHHTLNGNTANALAPDSLTDLGGGACFNDAQVEVEKLEA